MGRPVQAQQVQVDLETVSIEFPNGLDFRDSGNTARITFRNNSNQAANNAELEASYSGRRILNEHVNIPAGQSITRELDVGDINPPRHGNQLYVQVYAAIWPDGSVATDNPMNNNSKTRGQDLFYEEEAPASADLTVTNMQFVGQGSPQQNVQQQVRLNVQNIGPDRAAQITMNLTILRGRETVWTFNQGAQNVQGNGGTATIIQWVPGNAFAQTGNYTLEGSVAFSGESEAMTDPNGNNNIAQSVAFEVTGPRYENLIQLISLQTETRAVVQGQTKDMNVIVRNSDFARNFANRPVANVYVETKVYKSLGNNAYDLRQTFVTERLTLGSGQQETRTHRFTYNQTGAWRIISELKIDGDQALLNRNAFYRRQVINVNVEAANARDASTADLRLQVADNTIPPIFIPERLFIGQDHPISITFTVRNAGPGNVEQAYLSTQCAQLNPENNQRVRLVDLSVVDSNGRAVPNANATRIPIANLATGQELAFLVEFVSPFRGGGECSSEVGFTANSLRMTDPDRRNNTTQLLFPQSRFVNQVDLEVTDVYMDGDPAPGGGNTVTMEIQNNGPDNFNPDPSRRPPNNNNTFTVSLDLKYNPDTAERRDVRNQNAQGLSINIPPGETHTHVFQNVTLEEADTIKFLGNVVHDQHQVQDRDISNNFAYSDVLDIAAAPDPDAIDVGITKIVEDMVVGRKYQNSVFGRNPGNRDVQVTARIDMQYEGTIQPSEKVEQVVSIRAGETKNIYLESKHRLLAGNYVLYYQLIYPDDPAQDNNATERSTLVGANGAAPANNGAQPEEEAPDDEPGENEEPAPAEAEEDAGQGHEDCNDPEGLSGRGYFKCLVWPKYQAERCLNCHDFKNRHNNIFPLHREAFREYNQGQGQAVAQACAQCHEPKFTGFVKTAGNWRAVEANEQIPQNQIEDGWRLPPRNMYFNAASDPNEVYTRVKQLVDIEEHHIGMDPFIRWCFRNLPGDSVPARGGGLPGNRRRADNQLVDEWQNWVQLIEGWVEAEDR